MKILAKLLIGFLAIAVLCAVVGVVGMIQMRRLTNDLREMAEVTIPSLDYLNIIAKEFLKLKSADFNLANAMGEEDPQFVAEQLSSINAARTAYRPSFEAFEKLDKVPEEEKLWANVKASLDKGAAYTNKIVEMSKKLSSIEDGELRDAGYREIYAYVYGEDKQAVEDLISNLDKLIDFSQNYYGVEHSAAAVSAANIGTITLLTVTVLSLLAAILLGVVFGVSMSRSLTKAVAVLDKIAQGDLSERLNVKSKDEFLQVAASLNTVADTIDALIGETGALAGSAVAGQLSARGDAEKFKGGYRAIIEGMNNTMDAVVGPLNVAAAYFDRISKGDIPQKITESYNGDFNLIITNINVCIDAVNALVSDTGMLAQTAIEGQLAARADASKHMGDFRKIVEGINRTLDLVINPINETTAVLKQMADSDFTALITGDYKGDFDILKTSLNETIKSINEILAQVRTAAEQVAAGSLQVSQASQALSQGATEQASSLEEITASVTEISSQTRLSTENAAQANSLSKSAQASAEQGNVEMKELVAAMGDINSSAEEIRKIVNAIDDIAFQINLLALNANVEAARAGKYGKGFAVVAEEVRNLAVRSANSVKETTKMVDMAISNINRGNGLVEITAKQLNSIVDGSAQVADLSEQASLASKEQSLGLEQISTGLNQIDQVTQANTASAEESASAAEELSAQAQQLRAMLARFKLMSATSKSDNSEVLQMLRAELARQSERKSVGIVPEPASAARIKPIRSGKSSPNPADLISLDDNDFGKF